MGSRSVVQASFELLSLVNPLAYPPKVLGLQIRGMVPGTKPDILVYNACPFLSPSLLAGHLMSLELLSTGRDSGA